MERLQAMMPVFLDCNFGNNKGILLGIMEEGITNEDIGPCHTFPWNSGERRVLVANCLFCFRISAPNQSCIAGTKIRHATIVITVKGSTSTWC